MKGTVYSSDFVNHGLKRTVNLRARNLEPNLAFVTLEESTSGRKGLPWGKNAIRLYVSDYLGMFKWGLVIFLRA